jgi:hypothetical protein
MMNQTYLDHKAQEWKGILCLLFNSGREIMPTYKCKNPLTIEE